MLSGTVTTLAKVDKVTTHVARHLLANFGLHQFKTLKPSHRLGPYSVKMTESYLRELTGTKQDALLYTTFAGF